MKIKFLNLSKFIIKLNTQLLINKYFYIHIIKTIKKFSIDKLNFKK